MIVSLTAYNRPELLREVLDSFAVAREYVNEAVFLVAAVDHGPERPVILDMLGSERGTYTVVQEKRAGLQRNTLAALDEAWRIARHFNEDFVLHLEDDLLLAPDALRLAAWQRDEYRDDTQVTFTGLTSVLRAPVPEDWHRVYRAKWFDCHAWGTWWPIWNKRLRPNWPHEWPDHWAATVNAHELWGGWQVLPALARSCSIGVYGQHCNPGYHERHNPELYAGDVDHTLEDAPYFEAGPWPEPDTRSYVGPEFGVRQLVP